MREIDHTAREHALLSPSSAHRWLMCTKSARIEDKLPDTTSQAAEEGTVAHEICELKARKSFSLITNEEYEDQVAVHKANSYFDTEMENYTDYYVDFLKEEAMKFEAPPIVLLEESLDLDVVAPESFGTADCIMVQGGTLEVIDFKYGKGVPVASVENPQMIIYAIGAYSLLKPIYQINRVKMAICQPRLHNDSCWEITLEDLLKYHESYSEIAEIAYKGEGTFRPGDWCKFCRARYTCRSRADENIRLAFAIDKKPEMLTNSEIGEYLKKGEQVAKWLKDLQDHALAECLKGNKIKGYKAVEGRGRRDWVDMDKAFAVLVSNGIAEELLWERKPLTLAKTEKIVGKKEFNSLVGDYVVKAPGKPTLVEESDKREAITNMVTAEDIFGNK